MGDDNNTNKKDEAMTKGAVASFSVLGFLIITFIWVWIIAGLLAFLASILFIIVIIVLALK